MPSGAKKRKAAKKHKQKVASTSSNIHNSHGDEDLKHHENESGIDVKNGNEEREKRVGEDEGIVQIEGESKGNDESSSDGTSRSNSSSDSDDESPIEKDIMAIDTVDTLPVDPTHTSPINKIDDSVETVEAVNTSSLDQQVIIESSAAIELVVNEVVRDLSPKPNKDESENHAEASDQACVVSEEKVVLSYDSPRNDAIKDGENGTSDSQRPIALPTRPVQTTSWKSCCGLFEAFSGSNR